MSADFIPALRFDRLTPLFDAVVAVTARDNAVKRRVVEHARIASGDDVLDVGCGTGTLALLASRVAPGVSVTGLDADPKILARAREKTKDAAVELDEATSTAMPYEDDRFDVVLSTLFFHHLTDEAKRATAEEIRRVLRPGGRLVVGDLGRPHDPLMRIAVRATVQLLDGTATTSLNVRGGLSQVLADGGLQDVSVRERLRTPVGSYDILTARR